MARKSILMLLVSACLVAASSLFLLVDSLRDDGAKPTAGRSSASTPTPTTDSSVAKQHAEVEVSLPPVVQIGAIPLRPVASCNSKVADPMAGLQWPTACKTAPEPCASWSVRPISQLPSA